MKKLILIMMMVMMIGLVSAGGIELIGGDKVVSKQVTASLVPEVKGLQILEFDKNNPCTITGQFEVTCEIADDKLASLSTVESRIVTNTLVYDKLAEKLVQEEVLVKDYDLSKIDATTTVNTLTKKVIYDLSTLKDGEVFHYGENSTTVSLDYTYVLADGTIWEGGSGGEFIAVSKWQMDSVYDVAVSIDSAKLCYFIKKIGAGGNPGTNVDIWVDASQTWTEGSFSTLTDGYEVLTNNTQKTRTSSTNQTLSCVDVTDQVRYGFDQTWDNLTILMEDSDFIGNVYGGGSFSETGSPYYLTYGTFGMMGDVYLEHQDREGSSGTGTRPYLNVTYTTSVDNFPTVHLVSPANGSQSSLETYKEINFTCNITDDIGIGNLSLYLSNSTGGAFVLNQTTQLTGTTNQTSWVLNLTVPSNYLWNCYGVDSASQGNFSEEGNRTLVLTYNPTPRMLFKIYDFLLGQTSLEFWTNSTIVFGKSGAWIGGDTSGEFNIASTTINLVGNITIQGTAGYSGTCSSVTYISGIATECND